MPNQNHPAQNLMTDEVLELLEGGGIISRKPIHTEGQIALLRKIIICQLLVSLSPLLYIKPVEINYISTCICLRDYSHFEVEP